MSSIVHCDIPAFEALVKKEYLYDMDPEKVGSYEQCTVYAVSSYKGHYLTFKIALSDGALFDYIPLSGLLEPGNAGIAFPIKEELNLSDLCFGFECPSNNIVVNSFEWLKQLPTPWCWFLSKLKWMKAVKYICTIDWFEDNENVNLVILDNGQLACVPNHKMLFVKDQPTILPDYRMINEKWNSESDR